jgi:hypothetical protein
MRGGVGLMCGRAPSGPDVIGHPLHFGNWLFINDLIWHGWPGRSSAMTMLAWRCLYGDVGGTVFV